MIPLKSVSCLEVDSAQYRNSASIHSAISYWFEVHLLSIGKLVHLHILNVNFCCMVYSSAKCH